VRLAAESVSHGHGNKWGFASVTQSRGRPARDVESGTSAAKDASGFATMIERDQPLRIWRAVTGALTIMMRSGTILDFELVELGSEVFVRIWSSGDLEDSRLRGQIAALLPTYVDERHIWIEAQGGDISNPPPKRARGP
jgi:hypothetical protein